MNLFIYDFDDTLFPSYCYVKHIINYNDFRIFLSLDNIIYDLLKYTYSLGHIIILSDGDSSWLKEVIGHLPKTKKFINDNIPIISTVVYYADRNRQDVLNYKYNYIVNNIKIKNYKNVLLIGDGPSEKNASEKLMKKYNNIKHIEFKFQPTLKEWINEIKFFYNNLLDIIKLKEKKFYLN